MSRGNDAVQMLDQCGLAGTGVTDQTNEFAGLDLDIHVVQRHFFEGGTFIINVGQMVYLN